MVSMGELFLLMHERGASDLHLTVGAPPVLRGLRTPSRSCASSAFRASARVVAGVSDTSKIPYLLLVYRTYVDVHCS